jgi:hypothetical protein
MVSTLLRLDNAASYAFSTLHKNVPGLSWWALCKL